jgi:hypothetical protein
MLSSFPRKDAAAKVARTHVKVALIVLPRRFLAFLLRKRFLSTEKKRKERERERERVACAVCPTFEFVVYLRILAEMNWPKIDIFLFKI